MKNKLKIFLFVFKNSVSFNGTHNLYQPYYIDVLGPGN